MTSFNTTIYETIEVFHPQFTNGYAEMELECNVSVYVDSEDRSVGIFGDSLVAEDIKIVEISIHDGDKIHKISEEIAEQLVPEDEWEKAINKAMKAAEDFEQY